MEPVNVFNQRCGSRRVLLLISGRWTVLVIYALSQGAHRHGELKRLIGGVSQKMLTETLRSLEQAGLVSRRVIAGSITQVEYSLTPLGASLIEPLGGLCRWAEQNLDHVRAATAD